MRQCIINQWMYPEHSSSLDRELNINPASSLLLLKGVRKMALPERRLAPDPGALSMEKPLDIVIVGAGAAGVGCAIVLKQLGITRFKVLERSAIGASFTRWPKEMRFLTPSFLSNDVGLVDLNAV